MTTEPLEPTPPSQPEPAGRGPASATVLAGALLVLVGVAWLLDANGVEVPWRAVLPAALIAVGLATAAGSMRGRQHGLMVLGLALTLVLAVAVGTDWGLEVTLVGGVGDRVEEPCAHVRAHLPGGGVEGEPRKARDMLDLGQRDLHVAHRSPRGPAGTQVADRPVG